MELTRRDFVTLTGAAALGFSASPVSAAGAAQSGAPGSPGAPWHQRVRRVGQVNFSERDPLDADVEAWADYWASARVDAILLNVTGMIAFYPSKVPFHRHSRFLHGRDFFGECCAAAKARGIRVIGRLSPDLQWEDVIPQKPEWFMRDRQGNPVPVFSQAPGLYQTCAFTSYFAEFTPAVMREVNARYDIDGLYANGWPNFHVPSCWCAVCRTVGEPGTMEYHRAYMDRCIEIWTLYDRIAKEKRPENLFFGNLGGGVRSGLDLKRLGDHAGWFNADNQGRTGAAPAWGAAQQGRVAQAVMKGRTITNVTGAWSTGSPMWRNAHKSPAEAESWMAQTVASGMVVWYHWLGAQTGLGEDRRWQETGRRFLTWHARHDRHFVNRSSIASVGIVLGQRTQTFYKPPAPGDAGEYVEGFYYALLEKRTPFDFVHEDDLSPETLRKYAALILPNVAFLSDTQCRQLEAFVASGGSLLATFETGLYDERGQPRADFGLARLFGIRKAGAPEGARGFMNSAYFRIERPHEILAGFEGTNWIPGSEWRVPTRADGPHVLTVVPPFTAYPTEAIHTDTPRTDEPAMVLREQGPARLVYLPGDVGRTAWRSGHPDVTRLIQNAVEWMLRGRRPLQVDGDGVVEVFAWETEPGFALHLLNYTNPNLHRGSIRRHYPIGPQKVRWQLPPGVRVRSASLLRAETTLPVTQVGDIVEFTIPGVVDYEVAALEA
jgi:hypothetical protein